MMKLWCYSCVILLLPALCWSQNEPGYFITAPDVVRVGVSETVLVSLRNTGANAIPIKLLLQSFPSKDVTYAEATVAVEANQPQTASLKIDPSDVPAVDHGVKQYVYLVAKSESEVFEFEEETVILMSYKAGYVFIQTDKPIYTPDHDVKIRLVSLNQEMRPSDSPIRVEIRNPQDVIVKLVESVKSLTGFITQTFHFPSHPLFGNWSVVAYYGHKHQHNTTVQFLVKEYVLPTFSVTIATVENYILPGTTELLTDIRAKYKFGEPVKGSYHVEYSVLLPSGEMRTLNIPQAGELNSHGHAVSLLRTAELQLDWFNAYVGSRLLIQAYITEDSSGTTETANNTQVLFVNSPYVIRYDHTAKYFKKDLPFEVKATIFEANGQLASQIPVNIIASATTGSGQVPLAGEEKNGIPEANMKIANHFGQVKFRLNVPADTTQINMTLQTSNANIGDIYNARTSFIVNPQQSPSGSSYLLARIRSNSIEVGNRVDIDLQKTGDNSESTFHVLIISRGQIVAHKSETSANKNVVMSLDVTFDMVPHARLVAYFIDSQNHVIADSLWFDVVDSCGDNEVRFVQDYPVNQKFKPGERLDLNVEGVPGTKVGLLAVDSAVYMLQDFDKLTGDKMFKTMEAYDLGCGYGGGLNVPSMFKDSGVTVITNADLLIPLREDESCVESSRRKRKAIRDVTVSEYNDQILQAFCDLGKRQPSGSTTCLERRDERARMHSLQLNDPKIQAFYNCCKEAFEDENEPNRGRIAGGSGNAVQDLPHPSTQTDTHVRSFFPETWIFDELEIGPFGFETFTTNTPDSITTWIIQAVGVSSTHGMCVADATRLRVQPDFFILVHLPYSVVRLEQVEIVATIFNYHSQNLSVRVFLRGVDGVCSESAPGEYSQPRDFNIRSRDSVTVKYNIVPLKIGEFPVEIFVTSRIGNDAVTKILKVMPEGVKRERTIPVQLDPAGTRRQLDAARSQQGRSGGNTVINYFQHDQYRNIDEARQLDHINLDMPPGFVPNSHSISVNVIGNLLGSAITTVIEGLDSLLEMPRGCGEQTMLYMAPNVYILKYLKETDQLTPQVESVVYRYIEEGITRQLSHRREDGSFAIWGDNLNYPSSTWLTAFVNKVFCQAKEFFDNELFIDPKITCKAVEWLITNATAPDGSFVEIYKVHHMEMTGGLAGTATMTAFVLISLLECDCKNVYNYQDAITNARTYLENAVVDLERPYELAVVTYALALSGGSNVQEALRRMKEVSTFDPERSIRYWEPDASSLDPNNIPYWYEFRPSAITVETTSYALLAVLQVGELSYAHPIVNWLTEQRNYNGGFVSTQDTVVALQALSEYAALTSVDEVALECVMTNDVDAAYRETLSIHSGNLLVQQTFKVSLSMPHCESEYAALTSVDEVALECVMTNDVDAAYRETLSIHSGNLLVQQTFKGPESGKLIVETTGRGVGHLAVQVKYHSVDDQGERSPFELEINARESRSDSGRMGTDNTLYVEQEDIRSRVGHTASRSRIGRTRRDARSRVGVEAEDVPLVDDTANTATEDADRGRTDTIPVEDRGRSKGDFVADVDVCARYTGNGVTNMAIIDVGLYSGFKPIKSSLDKILTTPNTLVRRYEITDRSVIFYVDEIPRHESVCVPFTIIREYVVGKIQPVAVKVYDYYAPDKECVKFYHPTAQSELLATVCEGSTCHCAAGNCPKRACTANECSTSYLDVISKICSSSDTFAYKVSYGNRKSNGAGFDVYTLNIDSVLKIGNDFALEESFRANPSASVARQFWKSKNCQELQIGSKRHYLVIGRGGLKVQDERGEDSYQYIIDDTYVFEDWPFGNRATKSRYARQVDKLQRLQTQMESPGGGCLT
ncbi:complement C3-like [Amphiura filiformis]|uniref:complement C3-like n=1 Tax=Amphiura filiformis TaxID=82378 RepID=UPI003B215EB7